MKPPPIAIDAVQKLPFVYRQRITESYQDENGHMNMRYYLAVYDEAGYPLMAQVGLTAAFHQAQQTGGFDLEHHIHYLREVHIGDTVAVYARLIGRSAKRLHYMLFMVNETRAEVASTFECVNSFADLAQRRTAPFPAEIASQIDLMLKAHQALDWTAPLSGVMNA